MEKQILLASGYALLLKIRANYFKELTSPVYIKLTMSKKFGSKFGAMYETKEYQGQMVHEIKIAFVVFWDNDYLKEVITHELCHALQAEQDLELSHNRAFFAKLDYILVQQGLPVTSLEYRKAIKQY